MLDFDYVFQLIIFFNRRLISESVKGFSSVLQKLLRYFNGTITLTSFVPPFPIFHVIFCLNLNEALLLLLFSVMQSVKGVPFLNIIYYCTCSRGL